jgi:NAD(P)H dehydrogenase (quinone)
MSKVAIIYYSSTGTNKQLANAVAEGAAAAGGDVRVRIVEETAPDEAVDSNPAWRTFVDANKQEPRATLGDLEWADAVVFGTPTRYGNVSSQLKSFIDSTGGLWFKGKLKDKVYAGFTSAVNDHGGQETTLIALYTTFYHFGGLVVPPGYTDPSVFAAGGNPYGPSVTTGQEGKGPTEADVAHAQFLGKRVAEVAARLAS